MAFSLHMDANSGVDAAGFRHPPDIAVAKSSDLDAVNRIRREIGNDPSSPHYRKLTDIHVGLIAETTDAVTFLAKVGSGLIAHAEFFAATRTGASRLVLGVLNTNPRARVLHEKLGFLSIEKGSHGERMAKAIQRSSGV